jgi:hypothetical protein
MDNQRQYSEAVAEARRLVKRSEEDTWRLAQLTWEQLQAGCTQQQWADDVGLSRRSVRRLAAVWDRFGAAVLANPTSRPSAAEAMAEVDPGAGHWPNQERTKEALQQMSPEQKAEVVREALAEPEVAERVIRDPDARRSVRQATDRYDHDHQERAREDYELREARSVQIGAMADFEYAETKARQAFEDARDAAEKMTAYGWPDDNQQRAQVLHQRAMAAGELAGQAIRGEDLDEELKTLVQGGDA